MTNNITINGIDGSIAHCEAKGFGKIFMAYANECPNEEIMAIGFNPHSGYVYIALENGVSICSCMGHQVDYLVTDTHNGNEEFFETYKEAIENA
jgi:hypothetical protein